VNFRRYLVLAALIFFGSFGDVAISYGMKQVGAISVAHWTMLFAAIFHPWVAIGILLLLGFFACYLTALSWADLTYVLPAASLGYVLLALLSRYLLHENVTLLRWVGILLVSSGVGIVTRGPSQTSRSDESGRVRRIQTYGGDL
jgi:drug/metabolite transporter (DMT)-like permease